MKLPTLTNSPLIPPKKLSKHIKSEKDVNTNNHYIDATGGGNDTMRANKDQQQVIIKLRNNFDQHFKSFNDVRGSSNKN